MADAHAVKNNSNLFNIRKNTHCNGAKSRRMKEITAELKTRLPVWQAFAELFLDTEPDETCYRYIIRTCASSPYSVGELERILFNEVWPALYPNLLSAAGNWTGWSDEFLTERITKNRNTNPLIPWRFNPLKRFFLKDSWERIFSELSNTTTPDAI